MKKALQYFLLFILLLSLSACASSPDKQHDYYDEDDGYQTELISDPLEGWNRIVFAFNDIVITYVAKPIRAGYEFVTPDFVQTGISNFFHNLTTPARFVSNLLQGKLDGAGVELGRLMVNTVVGIGGLIDVAEHIEGLERLNDDEDIGQLLGAWGVGEGIYIVWPFFGPSNVRDTFGLVGNYYLHPIPYMSPWELRLGLWGLEILDSLHNIIDAYDKVAGPAIDPYSAVRDAFIQNRRFRISE